MGDPLIFLDLPFNAISLTAGILTSFSIAVTVSLQRIRP